MLGLLAPVRTDLRHTHESAVAYWTPAQLGMDTVVLGPGASVTSPILHTPGLNFFMLIGTVSAAFTGRAFIVVWKPDDLDPITGPTVIAERPIPLTSPTIVTWPNALWTPDTSAWVWYFYTIAIVNDEAALTVTLTARMWGQRRAT